MTTRTPRDVHVVQKIGLQGLSCLVTLVTECSVTRAAESLQMSQPTMSNILARLRISLRDPLLVRTSHGMQPTPYATKLAEALRHHLKGLEAALAEQDVFDPTTVQGQVRIATSDSNGPLLTPFIARLRTQAPGLKLYVRHPNFSHIREWLEEGDCDIAVGYFPTLSKGLRQSPLYSDPHCCIASQTHPTIRQRLSLKQYVAATHVGFNSPFSGIPTGDEALNKALAGMNLERRVGVMLPSALMYGSVVAQTEMIATVGRHLARYFAALLPIRIFDLPFTAPPLSMSQVWHERTHQMGTFKWVRQLLREATQGATAS